jgi:cytochrome c556
VTRSFMPVLMVAAGLGAFAVALPSAAQFRKPAAAIEYRKGAMTVMSAHFYRAAAMAYGRVPFDAKAVADNIEVATFMSKLPFAGFVEGSETGDTNALPKMWTEMDKFRAAATKMQDEMTQLNSVAKTGNIDLIKPHVSATEKACKACHDEYRKE